MDGFEVEKYFSHDHEELDAAFVAFQKLKRMDYDAAKEYFKKFKFGLHRHIAWEEEILFPLFENATGMKEGGPTAVMREEHRQIKEALERIHKKVQVKDPNSDQEEALLWRVLKEHNDKEESILYPAIDRLVPEKERLAAYEQMKSMPQETYKTCSCNHHNH